MGVGGSAESIAEHVWRSSPGRGGPRDRYQDRVTWLLLVWGPWGSHSSSLGLFPSLQNVISRQWATWSQAKIRQARVPITDQAPRTAGLQRKVASCWTFIPSSTKCRKQPLPSRAAVRLADVWKASHSVPENTSIPPGEPDPKVRSSLIDRTFLYSLCP